jgi:hypothetical protein
MGMQGNIAGFKEATTLHDQTLAQFNDLMKGIGDVTGVVGKFVPGVGGQILQGAAGVMQDS